MGANFSLTALQIRSVIMKKLTIVLAQQQVTTAFTQQQVSKSLNTTVRADSTS